MYFTTYGSIRQVPVLQVHWRTARRRSGYT